MFQKQTCGAIRFNNHFISDYRQPKNGLLRISMPQNDEHPAKLHYQCSVGISRSVLSSGLCSFFRQVGILVLVIREPGGYWVWITEEHED